MAYPFGPRENCDLLTHDYTDEAQWVDGPTEHEIEEDRQNTIRDAMLATTHLIDEPDADTESEPSFIGPERDIKYWEIHYDEADFSPEPDPEEVKVAAPIRFDSDKIRKARAARAFRKVLREGKPTSFRSTVGRNPQANQN